MNSKFDELAKSMAQAITRRQALRRFGVSVAWAALAVLGFGNNQAQAKDRAICCTYECKSGFGVFFTRTCVTGAASCPPPPYLSCALYSAKTAANCNLCGLG